MLSIEHGRVYTESFSINHMMKTGAASPTKNADGEQSGFATGCFLCHNHIKLTSYTIPEKKVTPKAAKVFYDGIGFLPTYPTLAHSTAPDLSIQQLAADIRSRLPIPSLQQTSVLLI